MTLGWLLRRCRSCNINCEDFEDAMHIRQSQDYMCGAPQTYFYCFRTQILLSLTVSIRSVSQE